MRVKEWKGTVVFLHEVAEGAAGRSWGVHVAELAGVPTHVVRRAASLMAALERHGGPLRKSASVHALPLFAATISDEEHEPEADNISPLIDALDKISPDNLSPKEALDALYRLKLLVPGCTDGSK
jgi:DNA mismatch repair protein MutS